MTFATLWTAAIETLWCLLLRVAGGFLALFVRRKNDYWLFYGRNGRFLDNTKYLSLWISTHVKNPPRLIYVHDMDNPPTLDNIQFIRHGTLSELVFLLQAGTVVADEVDQLIWRRRVFFTGKARLVQLWHGVFLKKGLELMPHHTRLQRLSGTKRSLLRLHTWAKRRFPEYDFFVSTSQYYTEHVFRPSFHAKTFLNSGYPRNDLLLNPKSFQQSALYIDIDSELIKRIEKYFKRGKIALYAPTFRRFNGKFINPQGVTLDDLANHAEKTGCFWLVKPHPWDPGWRNVKSTDHVVVLDGSIDVYPLLHLVNVMVTDYSSISYDFLLLDRPIVFFAYDRDEYIDRDDNLMFNYDDRTPGPKVYNVDALFDKVNKYLSGAPDEWHQERMNIRMIAFDNLAPTASRQIFEALRNKA